MSCLKSLKSHVQLTMHTFCVLILEEHAKSILKQVLQILTSHKKFDLKAFLLYIIDNSNFIGTLSGHVPAICFGDPITISI